MPTPDGFILPAAPIGSLSEYEARGGGAGLAAARRLGADGVLDELAASGLRGRGGAGFPTGTKWQAIRSGGADLGDRYVVANGAEGEPGSFKDRALLRRNPYQVLEGVAVAGEVLDARHLFVAVKARFEPERAALARAGAELDAAGWTSGRPITVVAGPDEYLFGEEKALLEVIEGEDPLPRFFPPYLYGLFSTSPQMGWSAGAEVPGGAPSGSNPTLVNNVETFAHVAAVLARGADWYRTFGSEASPGVTLVTVSGDTVRAGVAEIEMGTPLGEVVERVGGGMPAGRTVQAVLSGVANPVLTGDRLDTPMTYEALEGAGGGLGAAGFVVYDDRQDMVAVAHAVSRFLSVESCGQCPPCKLHSLAVTDHLDALLRGRGSADDLGAIDGRLARVTDANRCTLGLQERIVVGSILDRFGAAAAALAVPRADGPVPEPPVAKIVDIVDGRAVLDEDGHFRKRPDWTLAAAPHRRA